MPIGRTQAFIALWRKVSTRQAGVAMGNSRLGAGDDTNDALLFVQHILRGLDETVQSLVHGFCQALQQRGLPRALMSDNGAAMVAGEFTAGLARLGMLHQTTLPYSPYRNAKQEVFWARGESACFGHRRAANRLSGSPRQSNGQVEWFSGRSSWIIVGSFSSRCMRVLLPSPTLPQVRKRGTFDGTPGSGTGCARAT